MPDSVNKQPALQVGRVTAAVRDRATLLEPNKERPQQCGVEAHEAFIKKYSSVLHPHHVVLLRLKYRLAR